MCIYQYIYECVNTKQNDYTEQLYCFGRGDLTSHCSGTSEVASSISETLNCGKLTKLYDLDIQDICLWWIQQKWCK